MKKHAIFTQTQITSQQPQEDNLPPPGFIVANVGQQLHAILDIHIQTYRS